MSLCKAIYYGKERREPYQGSAAFDWSCHNHKSCPWCRSNRTYQQQKLALAAKAERHDQVSSPER